MAKTRLTCGNCGFGEELGAKQLKERTGDDGVLACPACGVPLTLPDGVKSPDPKKDKPATKARYAGIDAMTGLDDVIEGDVADGEITEDESPGPGGSAREEAGAPQDGDDKEEGSARECPEAKVFEEPENGPAPEPANDEPERDGRACAARGMAGQAAGAAKETIKKTIRYGRENPLFAAEILDRLFRGIAAGAESRFDRVAAASVRIGHCVLLGAAALALFFGVLISLRSLSLNPLLAGVTLSAMLLFAQYLALRGFELLDGYIEKSPSRLPGAAITDILSAFSMLAGLLSLLTGLILTVNYYSPVWLGTSALGVIGGYFAAAALLECRSRLNVSFEPALPVSETVVELTSVILKTIVAVVPFMFGLGSAAAVLCMIWPAVSMLLFNLNPLNTASFFVQESGLLFCAFSPILAYFFIILWAFIIQAAQGLLSLDKK